MSNGDNRHFKSLFSGAVSGVISRSATAPLERLKIMRQVAKTAQNEGMWQTFGNIYRMEGLRGFYKGNGVNAVRIMPYNAIQFASFHKYKEMFGVTKNTNGRLIAASSCAGMTSVLTCYPLDLIRSVITIQTGDKPKYKGITNTASIIYRERGVRGLYSGLHASMFGIIPYVGINLAVFDMLRYRFQPDASHPCFDMYNFGLGGVASTVSVATTYPTELVRRRLQLSGILGTNTYTGVTDCILRTWQCKGFSGFYQGFVPCFLRVIPAMSIVFGINERMRGWLDF